MHAYVQIIWNSPEHEGAKGYSCVQLRVFCDFCIFGVDQGGKQWSQLWSTR